MTTFEICPPAGLRTQHFNEHALHTEPCLIPKECYSSPASRSDSWIMSTSCLKGALATNMFAPKGAAYSHGCIITLRAEASGKKQWELCELLLYELRLLEKSSGSSANYLLEGIPQVTRKANLCRFSKNNDS